MRLDVIRDIATAVIDFCYPLRCESCREPIEAGRPALCGSCEAALASLEAQAACELCGMPVAEPQAPCPYCAGRGVPHYERITRLGVFRDPLKHLIHRMKYHGRWGIAELLADRLVAHEPARGLLQETDVIVPVALHPRRQIARGYNQAELIARRVAGACDIAFAEPLVRVRHTETQTHLHSHATREANLRDAFALSSARTIARKHVLVIDDVMTTGATLQSAARTLESAKPASLCAMVTAVADPRHRDFQSV